jgi:tRNA(Ile)-lysidine synthase
VETLLMRLATGSGAGGLASIPAVRGRIVRPLIDARRSDVVAYLEAIGQQWREDSTNSDTTRLRARVRHTLLPALEAINPRFVESTARTLAILGEEDSLLGDMADGFADAFSQAMPGEVSFDRKLMLTLTRPMVRRALREALVRALPESSRLEFEHVEALVDGLAGDGFARDLPEGLRAFSEYDRMIVSRRAEEPRPAAPTVLEIPGVAVLGEAGEMTAEPADLAPIPESDLTALLDRAKVRGTLVVDGPRPGDRLRPLGMKGTRKVSDLLIDAKVPRRRRPYTPVVRDGDEVVWVAGIRMSEEYRITSETTEAVRIVWTPKDESSEGKS